MNKGIFITLFLFGISIAALCQDNKIQSTGDLGIGTTQPKELLHLNSDFPNIRLGSSVAAENYTGELGGIMFSKHYDLHYVSKIYSKTNWQHDSYSSADLVFATAKDANLKDRLIIKSNGNIGIGIDQPNELMHLSSSKPKIRLGSSVAAENFTGELGGIVFSKHYDIHSVSKIYSKTSWSKDSYNSADLVFATAKNGNLEDRFIIRSNGYVGIGTTDPKNTLSVNGTIWAKEVKVTMTDAADWVFEDDYELKSLEEVETFINENKHLPDIPSADEFREQDMNVAEMNNKLLQKIEELTLYLIEQNKEIELLKRKMQEKETDHNN